MADALSMETAHEHLIVCGAGESFVIRISRFGAKASFWDEEACDYFDVQTLDAQAAREIARALTIAADRIEGKDTND